MPNLLHVDSAIHTDGSASREITAAFAEQWRAANPDGGYVYRDLAANPLPYLDAPAYAAVTTPADQHTDEHRAALEISQPVIDEVRAADVILLGVPMYNFSIPATLKTWLDRIISPAFFVNQETGEGELVGKRVVVATARGGSYLPGTPRAPYDFQEPYLRAVLGFIGLDRDLEFIHTEFTAAHRNPALAQFVDQAVALRQQANETARKLAVAS